jgi:hypothetical protein
MANAKALKFPRTERGDYSAKTAAYTLLPSDSGKTFAWNSSTNFKFTLPPVQKSQKGIFYHFVIATAATTASSNGHGITPNAVDKIVAPGVTAADAKYVYFDSSSDAVGNGFTLVSDGVDGWYVYNITGTLTRET